MYKSGPKNDSGDDPDVLRNSVPWKPQKRLL